MGEPSKLVCPLVNLVIRELLPDHDGSLKIGVVVSYDWTTWAIVLPSLAYKVLKIYAPVSFGKFLQGGTLSGAEWLPPNQARRLSNLKYSWGFLYDDPSFVRHVWGGGINRYGTEVLMSVGSRVRNFRGIHGSWLLVHQHRMGVVTTAVAWVGLGDDFGNPSMEAILSGVDTRTFNTICDTTSKLKTRGGAASQELSLKYRKRDKESISTGGFIPHKEPFFI